MDYLAILLNKKTKEAETCFVVDNGFSLCLPSLFSIYRSKLQVIRFSEPSSDKLNLNVMHNIAEVVYFISVPINQTFVASIIDHYSTHFSLTGNSKSPPKLTIFTSISQDYYQFKENSVKTPYQVIIEWFQPVHVDQLFHLPVHSARLLDDQKLSVFNLSSPSCRDLFPPLRPATVGEDFSLEDCSAVPMIGKVTKDEIRTLAHELASSLLFNYNLDPTKHIYTLGPCSQSIGKSMQSMLGDLRETRNSLSPLVLSTLSSRNPLASGITVHSELPLQKASLLIIDRTEDLYTPCSHGLSDQTPVAHRILSTITETQREESSSYNQSFDLNLNPKILQVFEGDDSRFVDPLNTPYSALSGIPLPLPPRLFSMLSLSNMLKQPSQQLLASILTEPEEKTRIELIEILRETIVSEKGQVPPLKKRGYGAEVLAYIQALLICPGDSIMASKISSNQIELLGYNPLICLKHESIIAQSFSIIEAMQRSSAKQFSATCTWKLAYESMAAREQSIVTSMKKLASSFNSSAVNVQGADLEHFLLQQKALLFSEGMQYICQMNDGQSPLDVAFVLLQIVRHASLFGHRVSDEAKDSANISSTAMLLQSHILYRSSEEELKHLCNMRILSREMLTDILSCRSDVSPSIKASANSKGGDDDWDPIGSDDDEDDVKTKIKRLELELLDLLYVYIDKVINHVGKSRTISIKSRSSDMFDECNLLQSYLQIAPSPGSILSSEGQNYGVVARTCNTILQYRQISDPDPKNPLKVRYPMANFQHVENSLSQLKRAGLELLSQGLGRFGLGSQAAVTPHAGGNSTIVVFVVGGISFEEIGQVKHAFSMKAGAGVNIILGSNNLFVPGDILKRF